MLNDKIGSLPLTPPVTVESGTGVGQVLSTVQRRNVGCVLVCREGKPIGIITERDVLLKIVARGVSDSEPVDQFMTPDPIALNAEHTIGDAAALMHEQRFRHIPIIGRNGEATGIVSIKDIINIIAESFPEQVLNLPPRPHQKMETPEGA